MKGSNPIRRQELGDGLTLHVEEVWRTIQGEGPFAGVPAVFVRLAGCWLKCFFCDTQFEAGMAREPVNVAALLGQVAALADKIRLVVLTGGDPLRQNIVPLVSLLTTEGFHVQIETAGVSWVPGLEEFMDLRPASMTEGYCSIVCSPKTGKVCDEVEWHACAWKYIVRAGDLRDPIDGLPLMSTQVEGKVQRLARPGHAGETYLQPCDEGDVETNQANAKKCAELALRYGYRVSIQQHKILQLP